MVRHDGPARAEMVVGYPALVRVSSGVLLKDAPPADLLTAIRVIAGGYAILAPAITRRLISEFAARPEPCRNPPPGPAGDL